MSRPISETPLENGDLLISDREEEHWQTSGMLFMDSDTVLCVFECIFYKVNAHKMCKISF